MSDLRELAKAYYRAYERYDRTFMEEHLAADFTFTSPFDDHIDRAAYFERCWPKQPLHQKFDFVTVMQDGDTVFVAYDCTMHIPNATHSAARFRNAELMTFQNGKLKSVDVFFGDPPAGLTRREFAVQSGAG
jgi:ketosteroid isomerase-like protein